MALSCKARKFNRQGDELMKLRKPSSRLFLALFLSLSTLSSGIGYESQVYAEGPSDPAPEVLHVGTANGKKVLFDNTHGQTAGAADWVIDGAFSDFANALAAQGYDSKELRKSTPIVLSDLSGYDVFITAEANIPYKTTEQTAMLQYVQNGGSIFFIGDHYNADRNKNRWDGSESFNGYRRGAWSNPALGMTTEESASSAMNGVASSDWLGSNFGIRFRYNALGDLTANQIVAPAQAFNITSGVTTVAMHAGSTLAIIDPNKAKGIVYLPSTTTKWASAVDQGVYNGGGIAEGPYAAVSKVGLGKAGFIGDSSPVEDATPKYKREETGGTKTTYDGFTEQNDGTLLVNIVNWLSTPETYTSLNQVSGLQLDSATTLLAIENPQTSTEPQSEPWAAPAAGYKWYDSSTFKTGSYGYVTTGGGGGTGSNLFISEYIEGSSNNKAIEIYNGSGASVNLSGYSLSLSNTTTAIALSGTVASGSVYVVANSSANAAILAQADLQSGNLTFNGDDSVSLVYNGSALDVVGTAGVSFGTNITLVRKSTVTSGAAAYNAAEWDSFAQDTSTNLGSHTAASSNHAPVVALALTNQAAAAGSGAFVVDATNTFSDSDGDSLTLTAASSSTAAATVSVSGKQLTVTPLAAGSAVITVTAADGHGGTVSTTFTVTVNAASTAVLILNEAFESGSKTAYTAGDVTLATGSWNLDNALIGNLSTDKKNGTQSARVKAAGALTMNFNVAGAKTVKVSYANFGSDTGASWKLQKSTNNGTSWSDASGTFTAASTLSEQTIALIENASVRFRIAVSGTTGSRINIDDIKIYN
jgi:hypothetical protein